MGILRNSIHLIGHLGSDPQTHQPEGGKLKCWFSLSTKEKYRNKKDEIVEETQWHDIVAWGKTAEFCVEFLKKGDKTAIEGKMTYRKYEKDGKERIAPEVVLREFIKMTSK